jgi:NAD(P)-dependent dehydrogenase (short-subunit alcohol dehydrogenase family)
MIDVNLLACIGLAKFLLPHFIEKKQGHIVNISSIAGLFPVPVRTAYCATKFGLSAYFAALRLEQEAFGNDIKVTNVYPGSTQTDVSKNARLVRRPLDCWLLNSLKTYWCRAMENRWALPMFRLRQACRCRASHSSCRRPSPIVLKSRGSVSVNRKLPSTRHSTRPGCIAR